MNILKFSFITLGFLMMGVSCQKDQTPVAINSEDDLKDNNALAFDYPNKIGSRWTYSVYDSLQARLDTVKVSIIDTTQMANHTKAFVWLYESPTRSDTHYVTIHHDTVTIFYNLEDTVPFAKYIFPLKVGNKWRRNLTSDSIMVVSKDTISVPAGVFESAFLIKMQWNKLDTKLHILTPLVPRVGMVKQVRRIRGFELENTTWELLDCFIK